MDSTYEKELVAVVPLIGYALNKEEPEYHSKFGNNLFQIQHIAIMRRIHFLHSIFPWYPNLVAYSSIFSGSQDVCSISL